MPCCNGRDRGFCPTAKAGRLPSGALLRENCTQTSKPESKQSFMKVALKHASGTGASWDSIDWKTVEKKVKAMQARIVKAKSKLGRVRRL